MSDPIRTSPPAPNPAQDEVLRAIAERRSLRTYQDRAVPRELLEQLAVSARWAPSNWNSQPWRFYFLDSKSDIERISDQMDARAREALARSEDHHFTHFVEHSLSYFHVVRNAPVVVAMFYKPFAPRMEVVISEFFADPLHGSGWNPNLISFGMAAQNLLLAAHALGLAACFHSGPVPFLNGVLHEFLGLHPKLVFGGLVTLGWPEPNEKPASGAKRKNLDLFCQFPSLEGRTEPG